jgi:DNA-binding GntR family transcriptional regulator
MAARRMTASEHANLISLHRKFRPYVQARDRESYHALNKTFHDAIYAGSHNQYLRTQTSALYDPDALRLASEEHQAIIDAIVAGDGEAAFNLLRDHVSLSNELFADLVAALSAGETEDVGWLLKGTA